MMKQIRRLVLALLYGMGCWAVISPVSGFAAVTNVSVVSYTYDPVDVAIQVNDTVQWTWAGPFHSTTSDTAGLWDSGVHSPPFTFTNKFTSAGTFPYYCTIHVTTLNMKGSVVVQSGAEPIPTLSSPERLSPSNFRFSYSGGLGKSYIVQRSGDLTNWINLSTNLIATNPVVFLDAAASNGLNFYRVELLPGP